MTRIEPIDADLFGFYPLAGSALAYGVRRVLILLANSHLKDLDSKTWSLPAVSVLAALRFKKAKRRGRAALHTLRDFGHGHRCF